MEKLLQNDWFVYFIVTLIFLILQRIIIYFQDKLIKKQSEIINLLEDSNKIEKNNEDEEFIDI